MGYSKLPKSFAAVSFTYTEMEDPEEHEFKMNILTGFVGLMFDAEGFLKPQLGWSIHCKKEENYCFEDVVEDVVIDGVDREEAKHVLRLAKLQGMDVSHLNVYEPTEFVPPRNVLAVRPAVQ